MVIESLDFMTTAGAGHAFRLDFMDIITPITNPTVPSGRDLIPNGVKPPRDTVFSAVDDASPTPVPPSASSYTRKLNVSP
jgi:hypothetical protein